eukprot:s60_g2.t1
MHLGAVLVELRLLSHVSHTPAKAGPAPLPILIAAGVVPLTTLLNLLVPQRRFPRHDAKEKLQRSTLWADEVGSFRSRQRRGHWHDNHRDTLTDWSRNLPLTRSEAAHDKPKPNQPGLRQSQSLPELRKRSEPNEPLEPSFFASAPLDFEEVRSMMRAKISDTTSQDKIAVERLKMDTQRFGQTAIERFRSAATVRASGHEEHLTVPADFTPGSGGGGGGALPWCELCQSRHSSLLASCER